MANRQLAFFVVLLFSCCFSCLAQTPATHSAVRWTEQTANDWYAHQPWLVGANYIPANAINELEMWQADSFDPKRIDLELGWAQSLGMNVMRVFLHDLLWQQDAKGFTLRIDTFLTIADKHHIKILFVLFDSCWDPNPQLGIQPVPAPECIIPAGCKAPAQRCWRIPRNIRGLKRMPKASSARSHLIKRILGLGRVERTGRHKRRQLRKG